MSSTEATSRPKLVSITETITAQIKRTARLTNLTDVKKEAAAPSEISSARSELELIKSPGSYKLKKEKVDQIQKNFYESHSSKLLHQVEDIDENDGENPQLLSEYVNDIYAYLFKLEKTFMIRENFLASQMDVTPKMRSVLLDWINEVHNQFSLEVETYHMTVSMIDRYLQSNTSTPRRFLQLVGVTILFMASKYEELMPPEINDFVYVTGELHETNLPSFDFNQLLFRQTTLTARSKSCRWKEKSSSLSTSTLQSRCQFTSSDVSQKPLGLWATVNTWLQSISWSWLRSTMK